MEGLQKGDPLLRIMLAKVPKQKRGPVYSLLSAIVSGARYKWSLTLGGVTGGVLLGRR